MLSNQSRVGLDLSARWTGGLRGGLAGMALCGLRMGSHLIRCAVPTWGSAIPS